jgi:sec-independent protein translocase protein TatB
MFSIPHLVIIFVVVLVVFGPEKLPELARNIGKIMGEFRRATGDLQHTFEDHLRDIERESSLRHPPASTGSTIAPPAAPATQNTIAQPKTDSASAPGTVPSDAPRGWTVAPPNPPAAENAGTPDGSSAETPGATQADVAHVQPDAVKVAQDPLVSPPLASPHGEQVKQPDTGQASAAGAPEPSHEKGSDGGIPN